MTCNNNDLTSLNVTKNTELEILECSGNVLTSLDVSNNIKLRYLEIGFSVFHRGNNLISIDISKNVVLYRFLCSNNNLTKLDVSNNTELEYLDSLNNIIECIQVNQYQLNSGSWNWHKDPNTIFSLDCNY